MVPRFRRGDIVVVRGMAVVLTSWPVFDTEDYLLCPLGPRGGLDPYELEVAPDDLSASKLSESCFVHPSYLFTLHERQIGSWAGHLTAGKLRQILDAVHDALEYDGEGDEQ